jgi:cytochrome c
MTGCGCGGMSRIRGPRTWRRADHNPFSRLRKSRIAQLRDELKPWGAFGIFRAPGAAGRLRGAIPPHLPLPPPLPSTRLLEAVMNNLIRTITDYKVAGAFLLAMLTTTVIGYIGNALVHPKKLATNAYVVDTSALASAGAGATAAAPAKPDPIAPLLAAANADAGKTLAQRQCATCHSFDKAGRNGVGPNLWNVVAGAKGAREGFRYSTPLLAAAKQAGDDGKWTYENLNQFVANPRGYLNGTLMAYAGMRSAQDRANLIVYLRALADSPAPLP